MIEHTVNLLFFTTKNILDTFKDEIKLMKELKNSRKNK
jgi:hypothetical protein